jgi:hypothetical protein
MACISKISIISQLFEKKFETGASLTKCKIGQQDRQGFDNRYSISHTSIINISNPTHNPDITVHT